MNNFIATEEFNLYYRQIHNTGAYDGDYNLCGMISILGDHLVGHTAAEYRDMCKDTATTLLTGNYPFQPNDREYITNSGKHGMPIDANILIHIANRLLDASLEIYTYDVRNNGYSIQRHTKQHATNTIRIVANGYHYERLVTIRLDLPTLGALYMRWYNSVLPIINEENDGRLALMLYSKELHEESMIAEDRRLALTIHYQELNLPPLPPLIDLCE